MGKKSNEDSIKKKLLNILDKNKGNISNACEAVKISRNTFYQWKERDSDFAEKVVEIENKVGDLVESRLLKNIMDGKETSTIFYCKTKLKNRGYIEQNNTKHMGDPDNPLHTINVDMSKLTNEQILKILDKNEE